LSFTPTPLQEIRNGSLLLQILLIVELFAGRHCLGGMAMSQEQVKEQISYLRSRIKRQREIIDGLEAEGYGGEIVRRSRFLLEGIIADLDNLLLQQRLPELGEPGLSDLGATKSHSSRL
jgi:hypothetical protein